MPGGVRPDVFADLADELPDEDLAEDLHDALDLYEYGSKPPAEEAEYLAALEDALERMGRSGRGHDEP